MGSLWEMTAFILHSLGAKDQQNIAYATVYNVLFLLAPLWINAFVYMTFARMVFYFTADQKVWRVKAVSLAKYFVWLDIGSFIVQAVGGTMATPGASPQIVQTGINVYMAGIGIQEAFILFFVGLMVVFHRRSEAVEKAGMHIRENSWRPLLYALYAVLVLITIRIIYRIAEFAGGITPSNPIPFHEEYAYALDAFPMMLAILILAVFHPGRTLVGVDSEFPRLTRKEKKAIKKAKKDAKKADKEAKKEEKAAKKAEKVARKEKSNTMDYGSDEAC